jgi:3-isopropylmalate/(R)-2-methylmalate dehydratase large subunit
MAQGATLVEKVIARAAGLEAVRPGQMVVAKVDFAFAHDSSGARRWKPILDALGAKVWDPARVALVNDHYAPATDPESAGFLRLTRQFAAEQGIDNLFDMVGICHLVLPEAGLIRPGDFIAGGDSHTPMAGAFGAYAAGYGATDMAAIVATGETWLSVPSTLRIEWSGAFGACVTAKDVMLHLTRAVGMDNAFRAVEFAGDAVAAMPMASRMVLCNMAAELGAETGVVAPDATTFAYLAATGRPVTDEAAALALASDADAAFEQVYRFDAAALEPQIAAPHSPGNTGPVSRYAGIAIDQAYIGACMGAKADDLRMAAEVLRGRKVAPGVRLLIAPASQSTFQTASDEGVLGDLIHAGAIIMPSGCGACAGYGSGVLADGEVCISTTNRNFKGRMGHPGSQVYLGSPYAVAAAAVAGRIVDPRELVAMAGAH